VNKYFDEIVENVSKLAAQRDALLSACEALLLVFPSEQELAESSEWGVTIDTFDIMNVIDAVKNVRNASDKQWDKLYGSGS
jgi:hypothetical protein